MGQIINGTRELLVWNPLVKTRPFCLIQPDGSRKVFTRDELKAKGDRYDQAAAVAITEMREVEL